MKIKTLFLLLSLVAIPCYSQCPTPPPVTVNGIVSPPAIPILTVISPYYVRFQIDPAIAGQTGFYAEREPFGGSFSVLNSGYPNGIINDTNELEPGQQFCYRTRAFNSCGGQSDESSEAMIVLPVAPEPYKLAPDVPTNLTATAVSGPKVVLNFTAGAFPGVSGTYNGHAYFQHQVIQYQRSNDGVTWHPINSLGVNPNASSVTVNYTDSNVASGQSYYYRVRSFNEFAWATGFAGSCGIQPTCGTAYSNVAQITLP
jgi:hypothetical protein